MRMWEGAIDIYSDKASRPCRGCRLLSGLHYWPSWRIISYEYREAEGWRIPGQSRSGGVMGHGWLRPQRNPSAQLSRLLLVSISSLALFRKLLTVFIGTPRMRVYCIYLT
jgi:hypothetical protein